MDYFDSKGSRKDQREVATIGLAQGLMDTNEHQFTAGDAEARSLIRLAFPRPSEQLRRSRGPFDHHWSGPDAAKAGKRLGHLPSP